MTWNDVFCNTFEALSEELGLPPAGKSLVELCRADDADFCQEVVAKGWLSEAQMAHAAERYRLGKSKNGKPIFWMIDKLAPLQGCVVSIYPHTDPTGCTYVSFLELADQARRLYDIDLSVVGILEEHASEEQKERCIDILDFITESSP